jgi:hypothetical protein
VAGGIIGAGFFLLVGAASEGLCEYECSDIEAPGYIGLGFMGALLGAGTGALLGAFFGSTIPLGDPPPAPSGEPRHPGDRIPSRERTARLSMRDGPPLASITVLAGYADLNGISTGEGGPSYQGRLLSHRGEWIAIGPELGHFATDPGVRFTLTGDVRIGRLDGRSRPYAIGDIGWYSWKDGPSLLGAGAGLGWDWSRPSGGPTYGLEGRYHWTLQNEDEPGNYAFVQVAASARFNW